MDRSERSTLNHGKNSGSVSRRNLLKAVGLAGLTSLVVAACGGGRSTSAPSATVPAAPTAAATSAPSAKPTTAPATSGNAQPAATAAPSTGPAITLNWFLPLSAAPEIAIWTDFVKRFQAANPNITIKGAYESWGNYWT
ncbi:MAG TPA: hypothetical protein VKX96_16940, partial [Chloroflexota bacterium]|nr:hypothetical protein [Chloroflexota bacterium]